MILINVNHNTTKSYKTQYGAVHAVKKIEEKSGESYMVIIAARDDGRFSPVFVLKADQLYRAVFFAQAGFNVCHA